MKPALLGGGLLLAGLATAALIRPPATAPGPVVDTARLTEVAEVHLPLERDSAAIIDLRDGRLLLAHHPDALRQRRILPGSVMKIFTAYAVIEAGRAERRFVCAGEHRDELGTVRPCWHRGGHGPMRLRTAIAESCNAWFFEQSQHLDDRRLLEVYREFGLGAGWSAASAGEARVKRDLVPGAVPVRDLPDVAVGDHVAFRVTPMSLLRAVSTIATRGRRVEPRAEGSPCPGPACLSPRLDRDRLELIAEGMAEAVSSGTLGGVFGDGQRVAAKTGTAKKWEVRGMRGLVVGFLPVDAPRYAFVVVKDDGQGARDAGPPAAALVQVLSPGPKAPR